MCGGSISSDASIAGRLELEEGFLRGVKRRVLEVGEFTFVFFLVCGECRYDADEVVARGHSVSTADRS